MTNKKVVQKIVLGGIVFNKEGKLLILQRHKDEETFPNMWELPSGKREPFEKSEESLLREIKEEAGEDEVRDSTQVNFLTKIVGEQEIKISNEHQKYAWVSKGELNTYNLSEATKAVLEKAFNLLQKIF